MRTFISLVGLLAATVAATPAAADKPNDILVVGNNSLSMKEVSLEEIRDIFLKKRTSWSRGGKAIPINAHKKTSLRQDFRKRVLGMSASEESRYWEERKIKNGIIKPAAMSNTLKAVFKIKGAVSYVYRDKFRKGIGKVLLELPAK